jgi:hypothetical protein
MAILNLDFSQPAGTDISQLGFKSTENSGVATINGAGQLQMAGGRYNLYEQTEFMSTASGYWQIFSFFPSTGSLPGGVAASQGPKSAQVMPDGSTNGYIFNFCTGGPGSWSGIMRTMSLSRGVPYTISVWASVPSGTGSFRPYYFDSPSTTVTGPEIQLTTTPTRVSWTFTIPGSGNTTSSSTVGFAQAANGATPQMVLWGAQLERSPVLTPYRPGTSQTVIQVWNYDVGTRNHYVEVDFLGTVLDQHFPILLRADSYSKSIGVRYVNGRLRIGPMNANALMEISPAAWPAGLSSPPCRVRAEVADDRLFLFVGPVGSKPTHSLIPGGLVISSSLWDVNSTKVGFGYYAWAGAATATLDNYEAGFSPAYMTPIKGRSETDGSDPISILPAPDSHNVPRWVEPFESNLGELVNRNFTTKGSGSYSRDNYSAWANRLTLQSLSANTLPQSNDLMTSAWTIIGGAQKLGYASTPLFNGRPDGTIVRFAPGAMSGIRSTPIPDVPGFGSGGTVRNTFSCYVASVSGTTTVRLGAIARDGNYTTQYSDDITVDETPKRINFTATQSGIQGAMGWHAALVQNSTLNSGDVVAWGFQAEYGASVTELVQEGQKTYPKFWVKPVETPRHYIEFDWLGSTNFRSSSVIAGAVRVMSDSNFVGILVEPVSSSSGRMFLYSPGRFKRDIGSASYQGRLRIEVQDNKIQVFTGPMKVRDAKTFLHEYTASSNLYDGFLTATETGWGFMDEVGNTSSAYAYGVADNYESGDNIGPPRFFPVAVDARSETRSDVVPRVDIVWSEFFDAPAGTPLVDLGFDFMTTEFQGDPKKAVVSANGRLSLLSGTKSSAIWTKPTLNLNHWIECTLYSYPVVNLEMPLIIRAASSEHFVGIWFENDSLVFGYRYATTTVEFTRVNKNQLTLPLRLRLEARGNYMYAYRSTTTSDLNPIQSIGSSSGYKLPDSTPLLKTSTRSGVGRINDIAAIDFADNYQAGLTLIPGTVLNINGNRSPTYTDDPDTIKPDDVARPRGFKARSATYQDRDEIKPKFEQFCTPVTGRSETLADVPEIQPEAVSYTRADRAVVTVDIVIVNKANSETRADEWHEPSTVEEGFIGRSETRADDVTTRTHSYIFSGEEPPEPQYQWYGIERPSFISATRSRTIADRPAITGFGLVGLEPGARSETKSDKALVIPQRFVKFAFKARSETYADATFAAVSFLITADDARSPTRADGPEPQLGDNYRPWLFT